MPKLNNSSVEIMAPAGNFESLASAIKAGADSVYFGVEQLNMRARAANFTLNDLPKIMKTCQKANVKTYLTLNTIMYDHDMNLMKKICDAAKKAKLTAVIASDIAAINYATEIGLEVHMSTQVNISNIEAIKFYSKFAEVIVLARELTLQQIKLIFLLTELYVLQFLENATCLLQLIMLLQIAEPACRIAGVVIG